MFYLGLQRLDVAFDVSDIILGASQVVLTLFNGSVKIPDGILFVEQLALETFDLCSELLSVSTLLFRISMNVLDLMNSPLLLVLAVLDM